MNYISDRELGQQPRTNEEISSGAWKGLFRLIDKGIADGSFGEHFPETCQDSAANVIGTHEQGFREAACAEIPGLPENFNAGSTLCIYDILDLLEFSANKIAFPVKGDYHKYFQHNHLSFNQERGREEFVKSVNRIFQRNCIIFELTQEGVMQRLGSPGLHEELISAIFQVEDTETNTLLEEARRRYLSPDINERKEAIDKLWDAFERIKTLELPTDKKRSAIQLLDRCADEDSPKFRGILEAEAEALTKIGNQLQIRHTEVKTEPISDSNHIDYLFHRMFSFLLLILRKTNRAS